jgi:hypothetical protein
MHQETEDTNQSCPVCGDILLNKTKTQIEYHINQHFEDKSHQTDAQLAQQLHQQQLDEQKKLATQLEYELLKVNYKK